MFQTLVMLYADISELGSKTEYSLTVVELGFFRAETDAQDASGAKFDQDIRNVRQKLHRLRNNSIKDELRQVFQQNLNIYVISISERVTLSKLRGRLETIQ